MNVKCYLTLIAAVGMFLTAIPVLGFTTNVEVKKEGAHYVEVTTVRFDEADLDGLDVDAASGSIHCKRWDKPFMEVRVVKKSRKDELDDAKEQFKELTVEASTSNGCGEVEVQKASLFTRLSVETFCKVPAGRDVELETGGGDIRINGIEGGVKAKSGGGDLEVEDCHGNVQLTTGGGDVQVKRLRGGLTAKSGGGDLDVEDCHGDVLLTTGGGDIEVRRLRGTLTVRTGGGDVSVQTCSGKVECKTGGGDVKLTDCGSGVEAKTGGGDIDAEDLGGDVTLLTGGGNVEVSQVKGKLSVKTGGGNIRINEARGIDARTGGGDISMSGVLGSVDAKTGGGEIDVEACGLSLEARGHFRLSSGGGGVTVTIPEKLPVDVAIRVRMGWLSWSGGKINCFFPLRQTEEEEGGVLGGKSILAKGVHLSGGFHIDIETHGADVVIDPCGR